jgi:chromosome segregation ATPase
MNNASATIAAEAALADAARARDSALRSIGELAQSLECLREAIMRANSEWHRRVSAANTGLGDIERGIVRSATPHQLVVRVAHS